MSDIIAENTATWKATVVDQYGVEMQNVTFTFKIAKVEEATGYVDNNFNVEGNDTTTAVLVGAERGDTFVLTITAIDNDGGSRASKDITVTVGVDINANTNDATNNYTNVLKATLKTQRNQLLGNN